MVRRTAKTAKKHAGEKRGRGNISLAVHLAPAQGLGARVL